MINKKSFPISTSNHQLTNYHEVTTALFWIAWLLRAAKSSPLVYWCSMETPHRCVWWVTMLQLTGPICMAMSLSRSHNRWDSTNKYGALKSPVHPSLLAW